MAHIDKFKASQVNGLLEHNARTDETRPHNHSNEDIDPTRTKDNYELHSTEGTAQQRHKARMSELHCMQRDDVTVLDSLVVTLPPDVKPEDERKFFQSCYAFACGDYGKENIINATVHKDETTPHIHIGFIPVVEDTIKRGEHKGETVEKVRHSALITKTYLETMHDRLSAHVAKDLGYEVSILNGSTAGRSKKVEELKAERAKAKAEEEEKKAAAAEKKAAELQGQVRELSQRVNDLTEQAEQAKERARIAEERAVTAESSLVNILHSVPPLVLEEKKPKPNLPDKYEWSKRPQSGFKQKRWDKGREKEQERINAEYEQYCAEVDERNAQTRQEWNDTYLTPDNLKKATNIIVKSKRAVDTDKERVAADKEKIAQQQQLLQQEREQLQQERERHAESVRNEALRLVKGVDEEIYGDEDTSRMERLESFCANIRRNGQTLLQAFNEKEQELAEERAAAVEQELSIRYDYDRGR